MADVTLTTNDAGDLVPAESPGPFQTLLGVLLHPRETFARMRDAQRGHWWLVLVIAIIALVFVTIATLPIEMEAAQAALQNLPEEQQAQAEQAQAIMSSQATLGAIGMATGVIGVVVGYGIRALVLFLFGLALGGRATFRQVFRMAVWTTLPNVLRNLVAAIAVFATGTLPAQGLSFILTPAEIANASPALLALLRSIDIFTVWSLALIAFGMIATSRFSRIKGAITAFGFWLLSVAWALGTTALSQALTNAFSYG